MAGVGRSWRGMVEGLSVGEMGGTRGEVGMRAGMMQILRGPD
jgi:hypothetical protein